MYMDELTSGSTNIDSDETDSCWNLQPSFQPNLDIYSSYAGLGLSQDPMKIKLADDNEPTVASLSHGQNSDQDMPSPWTPAPLSPGAMTDVFGAAPGLEAVADVQQMPPLSQLFSELLSGISNLESEDQLPAVQAIAMQMTGTLTATQNQLSVPTPPGRFPAMPQDSPFLQKLNGMRSNMEELLLCLQNSPDLAQQPQHVDPSLSAYQGAMAQAYGSVGHPSYAPSQW